ncbi:MAG: hypothetical protein DRI71_07490 [Bacteroidetes bacterium]|nr:MAG: hypothetical protein DRI71_07490 [Bacteroidota bacterium]
MRKAISTFILVAVIGIAKPAFAQEMGVSFSFFFPKNGYFSAPISPFSLRGIGFNITNNLALETGGSLYRMSGMNVTNLPFESKEPLVGPFFNLMVPVELILQFGNNDFEFRIKGGGFVFYNFGTKLNNGNLDRAFVDYFNWVVANSNLQFDNKIGYGYEFGVEYVQYFSRKFGVSLGANYFIGGSNLNFRGNVSGATNDSNGVIVTAVSYPDAKLDYTGLEISIGIIFSSR